MSRLVSGVSAHTHITELGERHCHRPLCQACKAVAESYAVCRVYVRPALPCRLVTVRCRSCAAPRSASGSAGRIQPECGNLWDLRLSRADKGALSPFCEI